MVNVDFETRSEAPLLKTGAYKYAADPTTQVLCMGWAIDNSKIQLWLPGEPMPWEIHNALKDKQQVVAFNAFFEKCIWRHVMVPKHGWPDVPDSQWACSASMVRAHALPGNLGQAGSALNLDVQKSEEGKRVMMKLAKPRTPTKNDPSIWAEGREDFEKLYTYCIDDVGAEREIHRRLPGLIPVEQRVWALDQQINERGIRVDMPAIEKAIAYMEIYSRKLTQELISLTGGAVETAFQRDRILAWVLKQGVTLTGMTKNDLLDALDPKKTANLPPVVRRVLEIRQAVGKTSTAKYQAIVDAASADHRVRDLLIYHGASTGRWTGRAVQPQNFPKNTLKGDLELHFSILKGYDYETYEMAYPDVINTLSSTIRGVFIPSGGCDFFGGDYSAIEARVLFWLADEKRGMSMFASGSDIYKDLAATIYSVPVDRVTKEQRDMGKRGVLGCLAKNTTVLSDSGIKYIQDVKPNDKLWDGEKWVEHSGLLKVGLKRVMDLKYLGIESTPDHLFLTSQGWRSAEEIVLSEDTKLLPSARRLASGKWCPQNFMSEQNVVSVFAAAAQMNRVLESTSYGSEKLRCALIALNLLEGKKGETQIETLTSSLIRAFAPGGSLRTTTQKGVVVIRETKTSETMVLGRLKWDSNLAEDSWNTLWDCVVGITGGSRSIALIIPKATEKAISVWLRKRKTIKTGVKECYDILNSGPRLRFWAGGLLAHNCGYGMGPVKFKATCMDFARVEISEELAERVITAYRTKYPTVKQLWLNQETAAKQAVEKKTPVRCGKVGWLMQGDFLYCQLPSGRKLAFHQPKIELMPTSWGEKKPTITYNSINSLTKQWDRATTYGGKIVENLCQAVARDLMADAMLRVEAHGYRVILTIHDELLTEKEFGSKEEFEKLMSQIPSWAVGCPIKAEAYRARRYEK